MSSPSESSRPGGGSPIEPPMSDGREPLRYLNRIERRLLGWTVVHLFATGNPRFERALEKSGEKATARMTCVNALRLYAIGLFLLGTMAKIEAVQPLAYGFYALAAAAMVWSSSFKPSRLARVQPSLSSPSPGCLRRSPGSFPSPAPPNCIDSTKTSARCR